MICPKCGFEQPDGGLECLRCGIVFNRYRPAAPAGAGGALHDGDRPARAAPAPGGTVYGGDPATATAPGGRVYGAGGGGLTPPAVAPGTGEPAGSHSGGGQPREPEAPAVVGMALRPAPAGAAAPAAPGATPAGGGFKLIHFSAPPRLGAGEVLGDSFSIFFRNFIPFLLISVVVIAPLFVAIVVASEVESRGTILALLALFSLLEGFIVTPVVTGAITFGVVQELRGREATIGECLRLGAASLPKVFLVAFLQGLVLLGGFIACIVPGLIAAAALAVAVPAALEERLSASAALRRSSELTRGHRGAIFLVILVLGVISYAVGRVAQILGPGATMGRPLTILLPSTAISPLTIALRATASAVMYYRLRSAKEGIDVAALTSVFD